VLDIGLPDQDGYELARELRARPGGSEYLLIALTGYAQQEDRRQSELAGIDHHLTKPIDIARLLDLLADRAKGTG
jgi:CheY-like chemotaxis protein